MRYRSRSPTSPPRCLATTLTCCAWLKHPTHHYPILQPFQPAEIVKVAKLFVKPGDEKLLDHQRGIYVGEGTLNTDGTGHVVYGDGDEEDMDASQV